jgi:hypothetical protein
LTKPILALVVAVCLILAFAGCGGSSTKSSTSGLPERVVLSQEVSTPTASGGLYLIDGRYDTIARTGPLSSGGAPGLMAISPTRNVLAAFDASSNTAFAINTVKESSIGNVRLHGPTSSMVVPLASPIAFAAVPSAVITGFAFQGAIEAMNFSNGGLTTIAVAGAQTVVSNSNGTQLLVFSNDSDAITVINPNAAAPPVDVSCYNNPPNPVCTVLTGSSFSRPVFAVVNGSTAYILNCGTQCGGQAFNGSSPLTCGPDPAVVVQACVAVLDLTSLTVTSTIPVDAANMALLSGSTLYVAGTSPVNNACTGQQTAATTCGRLDVVDLGSGTVTSTAVVTDGFHQRMDLTNLGQLFLGSRDCTNIGDVNNPSGEVRGCLSIYKTADGSVLIPPDNGDVNGLQGFTSRTIEYVAEGGALRVYDTTRDVLLINDFVPQGTINLTGYIGDVKAIDFF